MPSLITNMANFSPRHRGKVIGILDAAFSAGPASMALIYGVYFTLGHVTDEQNQDLKGFYLMSAVLFGIIALLEVLFLKQYNFPVDEDSNKQVNDVISKTADEYKTIHCDLTGCSLLTNFNFHFLLWSFLFCAGLQLMFQNNITVYLKSYSLEHYSTLFTTLNPIFGVISKFFVGFFSDAILHKVPRITVLFTFNVFQTAVLIVCIFWSNYLGVLVLALVGISFTNHTE